MIDGPDHPDGPTGYDYPERPWPDEGEDEDE